MLPVMLYGIAISLLLGGAAHWMDRGFRLLRQPARWVWGVALLGGAGFPLLAILTPGTRRSHEAYGTVIPLEALYRLWDVQATSEPAAAPLREALDAALFLGWAGASALLAVAFAGAALHLRHRSSAWASRRVGEEEVLVSDGLGPAVFGWVNPRIVLPPWALGLDADELEMVLLHESEHRRARDPALLAGGVLSLALAPWNPVLWWALKRLRLSVEGDCDRRVLARGVSRNRYGSLLLDLASGAQGSSLLAPALVEGRNTSLERRLRMMKSNVGRLRPGGAAAALAAGVTCLILACETPTPPAEAPAGQEPGLLAESSDEAGKAETVFIVREPDSSAPLASGAPETRTSKKGAVVKLRPVSEDGPQAEPLVYLDGVLLEGGKAALARLDPEEIDRVEVIKGAAAEALFGPEASGGVIQIFRKK